MKRAVRTGAVLSLCALLAACGSAPVVPVIDREPSAEAAPAATATAPRPATAPPSSPRRGGYYKDDGPGDGPVPDLASIEEPEPRVEPLHRFANNPYNVFGIDYVPMRTLGPFRQTGLASWYGKKFHGQKTSSGEIYDMYGMTAAHPTLPIPSYVRVTRSTDRRSVIVRVNDRGPFHPGRVIDLSYTAAWKLGYVDAGSTPVEVELIRPEEMPAIIAARRNERLARSTTVASTAPVAVKPAEAPGPVTAGSQDVVAVASSASTARTVAGASSNAAAGNVYVQLGAFSAREGAETFRAHVYRELAWLNQAIEILPGNNLFRLHLGPFRDRAEASGIVERMRETLEIRPVFVTR